MIDSIIELKDVWKIYRPNEVVVNALRGVDLRIKKSDYIAITGASGSGKSTFMHIIGCLDFPTKGKVFLEGRDITKMSENELAFARGQKIGFVFQFFNLLPQLTALENVMLPIGFQQNISTQEKEKKAMGVLELVEMGHRANHLPNQLSGGEQQRIAIARALINDPLILLADEPTGNLDTRTGHYIMGLFDKINQRGKTIVLVTHEADIAEHAEEIIQVKDGQILSIRKNHRHPGHLRKIVQPR
jgi:putative ABC transport system ATP-binding protein